MKKEQLEERDVNGEEENKGEIGKKTKLWECR